MAAVRSSGTSAERRLGEVLQAAFPGEPLESWPDLPGRPDWYLPGLRMAVFADGCFWHGCRKHCRMPEQNREYWGKKIQRNRLRDRRAGKALRGMGILPVRVWEHELKEGGREASRKLLRAAQRAKRELGYPGTL